MCVLRHIGIVPEIKQRKQFFCVVIFEEFTIFWQIFEWQNGVDNIDNSWSRLV